MTETPTASADQRKAALARAVQNEVVHGGRVESQSDYSAIVRYDKRVNHVLHLLLTLLTFTLWAWVWIGLAIYAAVKRHAISLTVDDYGNALRQNL